MTETDVYGQAFNYAQFDTVFTILGGKLTLTEAMAESYGLGVEEEDDESEE